MTAKQRAARAKFKAVVAEAKKLRKKNPKLTQAQAVKQAFAISYSKAGKKKVGAAPKKKAPTKVKAKKSRSTEMHTDTKSHNVNIRVMSGLSKITGVPHKAKYYIKYKQNSVDRVEYFDKLPKGYYKGMDRILYVMRFTDSGTSLIPIRNVKNDNSIKK